MRRTRVACLFPGQGLQYAGMGQSLVANGWLAQNIAECIAADLCRIGYPSDIIADMKTDRVDLPLCTQVAVYTHSILAWAAFEAAALDNGISTELVAAAGHSAGELAALVAGGAATPGLMAQIVYERTRLMEKAPDGALVNIERPLNDVTSLIELFHQESQSVRVYVSLIQGTSLTAVGGLRDAIESFSAFLTTRQVNHRLVVGVTKPLHTPEQSEIGKQFLAELRRFTFLPTRAPVISNTYAEPYTQEDTAATLASQIDNRVRFADVIKYIEGLRPELYLMFGPAEKLAELLSVYNKVDARIVRVINTSADLCEVLSELRVLSTGQALPHRRPDLTNLVEDVLASPEENLHVIIDPLGRVRSVADVLEDRAGVIICKGSFNPIHNLHVELLRAVRNERRSSVAMFAVSSETVKGELHPAELAWRIRWIHLAGFPVLLSRTGYFYKDFAYFKDNLPSKEVVFALGSDVLTRLLDYFTPEEFGRRLGRAYFRCRIRGNAAALKDRVSKHAEYSRISFLDAPSVPDVSSSRIRALREEGLFEEIRRLMPESAAEDYISSVETLSG